MATHADRERELERFRDELASRRPEWVPRVAPNAQASKSPPGWHLGDISGAAGKSLLIYLDPTHRTHVDYNGNQWKGDDLDLIRALCRLPDFSSTITLAAHLIGFRLKSHAKSNRSKPAVARTRVFEYRNQAGQVLFETVREELADGSKRIFQRRLDAHGRPVHNLNGVRFVPYRLPELIAAIDAGETIFVVEGEAKVSLLTSWGLVATCSPLGAGKWRSEYAEPFKRRRVPVVILPDNDETGRKHARQVAESLAPVAECIKIVHLPNLEAKGDIVDWARNGGTKELLLAFVDATWPWEPAAAPTSAPEATAETRDPEPLEPDVEPEPSPEEADDPEEKMGNAGRPVIRLVGGELPRVVDEAEAALLAANCGLYQRCGLVVRPVPCELPAADGRGTVAHRLVAVRPSHIAEVMTASAQFRKFDNRKKVWVAIDAPARIAETFLARERWRLPILAGVITAPTLRADGTILDEPGYDEASGLLFEPGCAGFPPISRMPSRPDALAALHLLEDLLAEFCFVAAVDKVVALSAILTAAVRRSLPNAPLHAFSSPTPGTGKSFLSDVCAMIAVGSLCPVICQAGDEEELEKRLASSLLAGDALISIDNCDRSLAGALLCQATTQEILRIRLLGQSRNVDVAARVMLLANGNNLIVDGDLARRVLLCELDAKLERPELRCFARDPLTAIAEDRGRFVVAALTLIRAYLAAGAPDPRPPLAGFAQWSKWVRDALCWVRLPDVVETIAKVRASDTRLSATAAILTIWHEIIGPRRITTNELIETAGSPTNADLRHALLAVAEKRGAIDPRLLGWWLTKNRDRIVAGLRIVRDGEVHKVATWRCQEA